MKTSALLISGLITLNAFAQDKPKLVIGIVIDQMRPDYLDRFNSSFGDGGFRRVLKEGYYFSNTSFGYTRTSTGPGHATIFTGCNPAQHGIVENHWPSADRRSAIYCVEDSAVSGVGNSDESGKRSPRNMLAPGIGDMLKLNSGGVSKVVGISFKDRASILPAGYMADLALWWDVKSGQWITSTYYRKELPAWLTQFEKTHPAKSYLGDWSFRKSQHDSVFAALNSKHEKSLREDGDPNPPYSFTEMSREQGIGIIRSSPQGNTYIFDLAESGIVGEGLGNDLNPDLLTISFSATDFIGHLYGPYSDEVSDLYRRFDSDLTKFLTFLDNIIGRDNYVMFITSDHGVSPNAPFMGELKIPSSIYDTEVLTSDLNAYLRSHYGQDSLLFSIQNDQVFLNFRKAEKSKIKSADLLRECSEYFQEREDVACVLSSHDLLYKDYTAFPRRQLQQGFYHHRSGDLSLVFRPFASEAHDEKGAGHGSVYNYDRMVPLIWYGKGVVPGRSYQDVDVTSIAATLADLLNIPRPPSCVAPSLADQIRK